MPPLPYAPHGYLTHGTGPNPHPELPSQPYAPPAAPSTGRLSEVPPTSARIPVCPLPAPAPAASREPLGRSIPPEDRDGGTPQTVPCIPPRSKDRIAPRLSACDNVRTSRHCTTIGGRVIELDSLCKHFGDIQAVNGLSLQVQPGEIYGLLGPNGAGKSTTLSMVCGLLEPDSGSVKIDGAGVREEPIRAKSALGYVPQDIALYEDLPARDNLLFWGRLNGLSGSALESRCREVLERVGLTERAKDRVRNFSGGMKRRINLAVAMLHKPKALLLDEPTAGVDPQARLAILDVVREAASEGSAVLYTTHYMEEAEQLCHRIGIVDSGKLLAQGTLEELTQQAGTGRMLLLRGRFQRAAMEKALAEFAGLTVLALEDGRATLLTAHADQTSELVQGLMSRGLDLQDIAVREPSLESLFLKLTGKELRD